MLGKIYFQGKFVPQNTKLAIDYFLRSANFNNSQAQAIIGMFYCNGIFLQKDFAKGLNMLIKSSYNGEHLSNFIIGYFYHNGKEVKREIFNAIKYYKKASSFNNIYAKNNLALLFRYGFNNDVNKNISLAIEYLEESVRKSEDMVVTYNLAHLYLYEKTIQDGFQKSIDLLIVLSSRFYPAKILLIIALVKKYGLNYEILKEKLSSQIKLYSDIYEMIKSNIPYDYSKSKTLYLDLEKAVFAYDCNLKPIIYSNLIGEKENETKSPDLPDINSYFYEGFGFDI